MNYEEMSDFEINCEVAKALGLEDLMFFSDEASYCPGPVWNTKSGITEEGIKISKGNPFDPCNSWAVAGPVIQVNEISLSSKCANGEWKASIFIGRNDIFDNYASCWNENPLRAAMIAFLMMQENTNV